MNWGETMPPPVEAGRELAFDWPIPATTMTMMQAVTVGLMPMRGKRRGPAAGDDASAGNGSVSCPVTGMTARKMNGCACRIATG